MADKFKVGNYKEFSDGVSTINGYIGTINTSSNNISTQVNGICSEDVFAGPAADECKSGCDNIKKALNVTMEEFDKEIVKLKVVEYNYKVSDAAAEQTISSIKEEK